MANIETVIDTHNRHVVVCCGLKFSRELVKTSSELTESCDQP